MLERKYTLLDVFRTIRDLRGVVFLDVRDQYGITQAAASRNSQLVDFASHISSESTVTLKGIVGKREEETYNQLV